MSDFALMTFKKDDRFVALYFSHHYHSTIPKRYVWLIGNFDGLHNGHIALIETAKKIAQDLNTHVGLLSFNPHPRMFFNKQQASINIMQQSHKIDLLNKLGVKHYYLHPFNQEFSSLSAQEFCDKIYQQLHPQHIVIGHDFHFGKDRAGTPQYMENFCKEHQIQCHIMPPEISENNIRYASETIRTLLKNGDIKSVNSFIKHNYMISGRVRHGKKLARQLGFPTANIIPNNLFLPKFGVYKCRVSNRLSNSKARESEHVVLNNMPAIANIGIKPTLNDNHVPTLEVHILNFSGDLYGQKLFIYFDDFLRAEQKFASLDALKTQISDDLKRIALIK